MARYLLSIVAGEQPDANGDEFVEWPGTSYVLPAEIYHWMDENGVGREDIWLLISPEEEGTGPITELIDQQTVDL